MVANKGERQCIPSAVSRPPGSKRALSPSPDEPASGNERIKRQCFGKRGEDGNVHDPQDELRMLRKQLLQAETANDELRHKLKDQQIQLSVTTDKLEVSKQELELLRGLLSTYDGASATDIGNQFDVLNNSIEKLCRDKAEHWLTPISKTKVHSNRMKLGDAQASATFKRLGPRLGQPLCKLLTSVDVINNTTYIIVQSAWQSCLVERVARILGAFSLTLVDQNESLLLNEVGRLMQEEGV